MRLIRILTDSAIYWLCNTWSSAQVFTSFWDIAHQISDIWTLATRLQNCHPPSFKPQKNEDKNAVQLYKIILNHTTKSSI